MNSNPAQFIARRLTEHGMKDRTERLGFTAYIAGKDSLVESTKDLTLEQLEHVARYLRSADDVEADIACWREDMAAAQWGLEELIEVAR